MLRKTLVMALVITFLLGTVSLASAGARSAAFSDVSASSDYNPEFTLLAAMNVFRGYGNGTVGPSDPLTRAQFAAVVVRMLNRDSSAVALQNTPTNFKDDAKIESWARGYIVVAQSLGFMGGYPDGTIQPNANVKYEEAFSMLLRALGLGQIVTGSWPSGVMVAADRVGLTKDMLPLAGMPISRADMARATAAALQAKYDYSATYGLIKGASLFDEKWGSRWISERVDSVDATAGEVTFASSGTFDVATDYYLVGAKSLSALQGLNATAFLNSDGDIAYIGTDQTVSYISGTVDRDETSAASYHQLVLTNGREVDLSGSYTITINGLRKQSGTNFSSLKDAFTRGYLADGDEVEITLDDNGEAIAIIASRTDIKDGIVTKFSSTDSLYWSTRTKTGSLTYAVGEVGSGLDESVEIDVDKNTEWRINGSSTDIDHVQDINNVASIDIVSKGAQGDLAQRVYIYTKTRSGTVTETRSTSSGRYYITIKDSRRNETEYRISADGIYDQPTKSWHTPSYAATLEGASVTVLLNGDGYVRSIVSSSASQFTYGLLTSMSSDGDPIYVQINDGSTVRYNTDTRSTPSAANPADYFAELTIADNHMGYFDWLAGGEVNHFVPFVAGGVDFDTLADSVDEADVEALGYTYGTVYSTGSNLLIENPDNGSLLVAASRVMVFEENGDFAGVSSLRTGQDVAVIIADDYGKNNDDVGRVVLIIILDF